MWTLPYKRELHTAACVCRYSVKPVPDESFRITSQKLRRNKLYRGYLNYSPLQAWRWFLHMHSTPHDVSLNDPAKIRVICWNKLKFWAIFLLISHCSLQYEDSLLAKKRGTDSNFQHIHSGATRVLQPSAECYHSWFLQNLQPSYCEDHRLYKKVAQQYTLSIRNDDLNSLNAFWK